MVPTSVPVGDSSEFAEFLKLLEGVGRRDFGYVGWDNVDYKGPSAHVVTVAVFMGISYERLKKMNFYDPVKWPKELCTPRSLLDVRLDRYSVDIADFKDAVFEKMRLIRKIIEFVPVDGRTAVHRRVLLLPVSRNVPANDESPAPEDPRDMGIFPRGLVVFPPIDKNPSSVEGNNFMIRLARAVRDHQLSVPDVGDHEGELPPLQSAPDVHICTTTDCSPTMILRAPTRNPQTPFSSDNPLFIFNNGVFHIGAQAYTKANSLANPVWLGDILKAYRLTENQQKAFLVANNPDICERESRIIVSVIYTLVYRNAAKVWCLNESMLTTKIAHAYFVEVARRSAIGCSIAVHTRFVEHIDELRDGVRARTPSITRRSRRAFLQLWSATGSSHYWMTEYQIIVEYEMLSPRMKALLNAYVFAQTVEDRAAIALDMHDEKFNLDVRFLTGHRWQRGTWARLMDVLPRLAALHMQRISVSGALAKRVRRLARHGGRREVGLSGQPLKTQRADADPEPAPDSHQRLWHIAFDMLDKSKIFDLSSSKINLFPFGYDAYLSRGDSALLSKAPDAPFTLGGTELSPEGFWLEHYLALRRENALRGQGVPFELPPARSVATGLGTPGLDGKEGSVESPAAPVRTPDEIFLLSKKNDVLKNMIMAHNVDRNVAKGHPGYVAVSGNKSELVDRIMIAGLGDAQWNLFLGSSDESAQKLAQLRSAVLPRGTLRALLLTASAKLRADRRRWLQKYATDPMVLEFGVDGKPFFSASAAETLLKKTIEHGRSTYTRSLSTLEFPVPVDSLWKYLGDCRLADQAVKKIPDAPKAIQVDTRGYTTRTMSLEIALDEQFQTNTFANSISSGAEQRRQIDFTPAYQGTSPCPVMPDNFLFYTDRADRAGAPPTSDMDISGKDGSEEDEDEDEDEDLVDDEEHGDQDELDEVELIDEAIDGDDDTRTDISDGSESDVGFDV
jgi:hypothetical protein